MLSFLPVPDSHRLDATPNVSDQGIDWCPLVPARESNLWDGWPFLVLGFCTFAGTLWGVFACGLPSSGGARIETWRLAGILAGVLAGSFLLSGYWIVRLRLALRSHRDLTKGLNQMLSSLRRRNRDLEQLSRTDSLTGVGNRLLLSETLEFEVERCDRYGDPLSMALVEIGGLRRLHVRMGRQSVDEAIRHAADRILACVEPADWIFRWADGEFVVLWLNTDTNRAEERAVKMYDALREGCIRDGQDLPVSVGATTYARHEGVDRFLARLDLAKKDLARGGVCNLSSDESELEAESSV
jgi:diguanylate cyclase (GGDEF)-like protein